MLEPLVPVTVTVYTPAWPEQAREEVPEVVRVVMSSVHVKPVLGEMVLVRVTVPVKPFEYVTVTVDDPVEPARIVTPVGFAVTPKAVPTL